MYNFIFTISIFFNIIHSTVLQPHLINTKLTAQGDFSINNHDAYYQNQYNNFDVNRMLYLVNQERASQGCAPLKLNNKLMKAAQEHSNYQSNIGHMSHTGYRGSSPFDRIKWMGYRSDGEAENVAYNQKSVDEVMNSWFNSPGHYSNIVNPRFTEMGAGMTDYYWTQTFGCGEYY